MTVASSVSKCELSAMLTGNPYYKIYPYEIKAEAFEIVDGILRDSLG